MTPIYPQDEEWKPAPKSVRRKPLFFEFGRNPEIPLFFAFDSIVSGIDSELQDEYVQRVLEVNEAALLFRENRAEIYIAGIGWRFAALDTGPSLNGLLYRGSDTPNTFPLPDFCWKNGRLSQRAPLA